MSYLVFARKYRPRTFSEILGQDAIVKTLTNAIKHKRIGQAYLFSGPRGTGKTSTARIFAKGLNCAKGPTLTPCLKCRPCEEIASGSSLDVLEIDGASNRGIDQIRALRELAKFSPSAGSYKVYLIDEVHQITAEGFNALLKTLEEPPAHLMFILATTAPHKVPSTILSRCQRYDFKRLPLSVISEKIKTVAKDEKLKISEEAVAGVAKAAGGSLRDAESILDQVTAFTGGKIQEKDLRILLGDLDEEIFVRAVEGIQAREPVKLLQLVAEASNGGTDLTQWGLGLLGFLRNLLVAKVGAGVLGFEDLGKESVERLSALSESFRVESLTGMIQEMTLALELMRRVGEPRIPLEVALVRLSTGGSLVSVSELLERLDALGDQVKRGGGVPAASPSVQSPVSRSASAPARQPAQPMKASTPPAPEAPVLKAEIAASGAPSSDLTGLLSVWRTFLSRLQAQKASTAAYMVSGRPVEIEPGDPPRVVVGFAKSAAFHCESLDHTETKRWVSELLSELMGHTVCCAFRVVESLPEGAGEQPLPEQEMKKQEAAPEKETAPKGPKGSSGLNSVLELFEGRVLPGEG